MESLKKRKLFIYLIVATAFLLVGTFVYALLRDDDPYKYFTGMGDEFDISPDDKHFLFSYYIDGQEGIYKANVDGTDVEQLTSSETDRHHAPKYSHDGTKIIFLSKNPEGINSLYIANEDGSQQKQLIPTSVHVSEAVFSYTGETIYYIGMPAEAFKKAEGETTEGFDLYSVNINGENIKQLTNENYFDMESLIVSHDGKAIYYRLFDMNKEKVTMYSLENKLEKEAAISEALPNDSYYIQLSPNEDKLAYTAIAEESLNSPLYEYELFIIDTEERQPKRLTDFNSSVVAPIFFHHQNQIAFLNYTNWPIDPAKNDLFVLDLGTEELQPVHMAVSNQNSSNWLIKGINQLVNGTTITVIYIIMIGLLITYLHQFHSKRKSYVPAIASLILTIIVFISSVIVAFNVDPWYGIGLGTFAAVLMGCTLLVFGYAFVLNLVGKSRKE
ncbi:DPP IV N-terminal domain-containing protein [Solibacillus sp. CAU 1738]|uniref:TolB family protein n=1 Tax=Solibacillus sp. CAU 1738 TaxID=3140363 RepID=UPI0032606892